MLIALLAVLIVIAVPAMGGDFSNLSHLRLRRAWVVSCALLAQILIISILSEPPPGLSKSLHIATYLAIGWFLFLNRHIRWMWVIALGGASNFVTILANNGVMPASGSALRQAGRAVSGGFNNSTTVRHPRLAFLGDIFATPHQLPLANVFSVGDLIMLVGLAALVTAVSRTSSDTQPPPCADVATSAPQDAAAMQPLRD